MKVESGKMKEQRLCQASESLYSVICSLYSLGRTYRYRPYGICTLCFLGHPQGMPLRRCTLSGTHKGCPYGVVLFRADTPVPPLRRCSLLGGHAGTAPTALFSFGWTRRYRPYGVVLFRAPTRDAPTALYSLGRTRQYRPYCICSLSCGHAEQGKDPFLQNPYRIS